MAHKNFDSNLIDYFHFVVAVNTESYLIARDVIIPPLKLSVTEDGLPAETSLTINIFPGESAHPPLNLMDTN